MKISTLSVVILITLIFGLFYASYNALFNDDHFLCTESVSFHSIEMISRKLTDRGIKHRIKVNYTTHRPVFVIDIKPLNSFQYKWLLDLTLKEKNIEFMLILNDI